MTTGGCMRRRGVTIVAIEKILFSVKGNIMDKENVLLRKNIDRLPVTTGVYLFCKNKEIVYICKAINIKERVKNHFLQPTHKDAFFIKKITNIRFLSTNSEIEALLLEARLIKKYQPKFNSVWRDDKHYFYVAIASGRGLTRKLTQNNAEIFPYIFITHQPRTLSVIASISEAISLKTRLPRRLRAARNDEKKIKYIGPFVDGTSLKKTLKYLRKIFPFYTSPRHSKKNCTWCHLGLCPGPNSDIQAYKKNIKKLILILQGKRKTVLRALKREMQKLSDEKKFEGAANVRNRILALENIMAHANVIENSPEAKNPFSTNFHDRGNLWKNMYWQKTEKKLRELLQVKTPISKIECYDISNIQGKQAVGSMVVFIGGKPDKSQYKKFRIRTENRPNDIAMLKEVLTRRLLHPEWGYPEIMLIDGGIAQLNVGITAKNNTRTNQTAVGFVRDIKNIKIISMAKGKRELLIENQKIHIPLKNLSQEVYNLIVHLDDEAHRFAITYHKKLRKKELLKEA